MWMVTKEDITFISGWQIDSNGFSFRQLYLQAINNWMSINLLKLNGNKSEVLLIGSKATLSKNHLLNISLDGSLFPICSQVKSLGVILDSALSFGPHISNITRTAYFHLRNISRLRPFLSQHNTHILVQALIISRIDYCNALLMGTTNKLLHRLQSIQNSAARIITNTRSTDHITPIFIQLHWLPVPYRINYKVLLLTFKALHDLAPSYLSDLLLPYNPPRTLRSSTAGILSVPTFRMSTMGARAFSRSAPRLWNSLPFHIRQIDSLPQFKSQLKTHLFRLAYST